MRNKKEEFILKINQLHINREFSKNLEIELSNQTTENVLKIIISDKNEIELIKLREPLLKLNSGRKHKTEKISFPIKK